MGRPKGGYSSETVFVEASWNESGRRCDTFLVLRMAPANPGTIRGYDLVSQFEAQVAAGTAGVPIAEPILETDPTWLDAPFIVMPRVNGRVISPLPHMDPWIATLSVPQRRLVLDGFLSSLTAVHGSDTGSALHVPRRDNGGELDYWEDYLSWARGGVVAPALADALSWCRHHQPAEESPAALLWGDVRFENCVFGDDCRLRAVLDWDMASVGAPEHDLAWFTSQEWTMHRIFGKRVDGFPDREEMVARFEELSGQPVNDLEWYETFAMVRSAAIMTRVNVLRQEAGKSVLVPLEQNPLLDLLRTRLT